MVEPTYPRFCGCFIDRNHGNVTDNVETSMHMYMNNESSPHQNNESPPHQNNESPPHQNNESPPHQNNESPPHKNKQNNESPPHKNKQNNESPPHQNKQNHAEIVLLGYFSAAFICYLYMPVLVGWLVTWRSVNTGIELKRA
eukprot:scpid99083/ scgid10486/ 